MIDALRAELAEDSLSRGYAGMDAEAVAASLNAADRSRVRSSMSGDEVFQATVATEFSSMSAANRTLWLSFCARAVINPAAAANVAFVQFVFGAGSQTVAALAAARQEPISRAAELGLGEVLPGHVEEARKLAAEARRG